MMKTIKQCCVWVLLVAVLAGGLHSVSASAQGSMGYGNMPGEDNFKKYLALKAKIRLRQVGLSPNIINNAVWAIYNKPESDCARLTNEILSADNGLTSLEEGAIINIERYHLCEKKNIKTPKPAPKPEPYDKNKDPIYQTKLFFRDHPQEAHDMLALEGVPEKVIRNASLILADGDFHDDSCSFDITNAIDHIRENKYIGQDMRNLKREGECWIDGQDDE